MRTSKNTKRKITSSTISDSKVLDFQILDYSIFIFQRPGLPGGLELALESLILILTRVNFLVNGQIQFENSLICSSLIYEIKF
jgi:hypothetical protein